MDQRKKQADKDILMEDLGEGLGYVQAFVQQEIESVKLEIAEKISMASSSLLTGLALTALSSLFLVFGAVALGFYLAELLASAALGFLVVAGIFLLLLLLIYLFRKPLITDRVVTAVIELIFDHKQDEKNSQPE